MKKITLFLAIAMIFVFTACGNAGTATPAPAAPASPAAPAPGAQVAESTGVARVQVCIISIHRK